MKSEPVLVLIKPDGMQKAIAGEVISLFLASDLKLTAMKLVRVSSRLAQSHYGHLRGEAYFPEIVSYLMGDLHGKNPVVAMVFTGVDAVAKARRIAGATNPEEADPKSVRGKFGRLTTKGVFENVVHVSSEAKEARREIALWFRKRGLMITGMTGFGAGEITFGKIKGVVEIKTVNHRYLDVAFYLPVGFSSLEDKIQKIVAGQMKRGRVTVSVKITDRPKTSIVLNQEAVKRYLDFARELGAKHHIKNDITVADIMRLPGVVEAKEVFVQAGELWPSLERSLQKAVAGVVAMRRREGKSLSADINGQLKRMLLQISSIKSRISVLLKASKSKMTSDEFSSYQKSNDIHEELERLAHYIDEAKTLLKQAEGSGKKLDFIAQEMQRETNTIGSKVQDKVVAAAVIAIKSKVEKIREQSNNVE